MSEEKKEEITFIKVTDLKPVVTPGINIRVRVVSKGEPRTVNTKYGKSRVCDVKIGDETGTVTFSVWGSKINEVNFGDLLEITNGFCREWQGYPQLSLGREGEMKKIEDDKFPDAKTILNKFLEENIEE
ncbi:MAG: DNA-binding protein [Asgard group archaeon]|nr:DNA-binding protein [Asgard group archaeon]